MRHHPTHVEKAESKQTHEFSRPINVTTLGEQVKNYIVEAHKDEREKVAHRFGWPQILSLKGYFELHREKEACFVAQARLRARCQRRCVVTLDLFEEDIDETFTLRFVPQERYQDEEVTEADFQQDSSLDELPYHGHFIDLGEACVQQLSLVSDPYPHGPHAQEPFQLYVDTQGKQHSHKPPKENVFSVLSRLKDKRRREKE